MIRSIGLWGLMLVLYVSAIAQSTPPRHNPPRLVNDWAKILSDQQVSILESKLVAFSDSNSTQIVILTQNGVDREPNEYGTDIIEKWGIGQQGLDNGVLIFVDPQKHNTYIATGRGAETWLPDLLAKRVVDNYLLPAFKAGDYYKGIDDATGIIMSLATGEYTEKDLKSSQGNDMPRWLPFVLIAGIFVLFSIIRRGGRGGGGRYHGGGGWIFTGGGFGGYSGGGGGGGFGGFGGGGSGGGGAGGSW